MDSVIRLLLDRQLLGLRELHLSANGITDRGFFKLVTFLKSCKDSLCPSLERLSLERNLVSVETRQSLRPLPSYISY